MERRVADRRIRQAFNAKRVAVDDERCVLGIWDTAGSERYESMSRIYYRAAKAALVCFDVRVGAGFERAKEWVRELQEQEPDCALYLVGCKTDLASGGAKRVDAGDVRAFADAVGAKLFETSAKTGANVDALFLSVAEDWLARRRQHGGAERDDLVKPGDNRPGCAC